MSTMISIAFGIFGRSRIIFAVASISRKVPASSRMESSWRSVSCTAYSASKSIPNSHTKLIRMIHLVNAGNNGPRCFEYRMYLITSIISRFTIKLEKCTTCENWSIIALVNFKTCPSVNKLVGRLFMRPTSSSTFFINSSILSTDPEMLERSIFILAAMMPFLSVRSKLVSSSKSSSA